LFSERIARLGTRVAQNQQIHHHAFSRNINEGVLDNYYLKGGVAMELRFA